MPGASCDANPLGRRRKIWIELDASGVLTVERHATAGTGVMRHVE
jgi:hypothetical protein